MPLYIGDYLGDTAHLTTEQHGAYLLLLMHQWRRGHIPSDEVSLAQITRATVARWKARIAPAVMAFFSVRDGVLVQSRLFAEMQKAQKNSEKSSQSAAARWNKNKPPQSSDINEQADANASSEHMRIACSSPSPSPSEKKVRDSANAESGEQEPTNVDSAPVSQAPKTRKPAAPKEAKKYPLPAMPDWVPSLEFENFIESRRQMRKPMTPLAVSELLKQLDGFRRQGIDIAAALNQSIAAGWQSVHPPRGGNVTHLRPKSHAERVADRYAFAAAPIEDVFGDLWGSRSDEFRGQTVDADPIAAEG